MDIDKVTSSGLSQTVTVRFLLWMKSYAQWLLGARNWITVIIERSDHSLVTYWGLNFCWWLFTTFWYVIFKKTLKSHVFWNLKKKRKIRILEHWVTSLHPMYNTTKHCIIKLRQNRLIGWSTTECICLWHRVSDSLIKLVWWSNKILICSKVPKLERRQLPYLRVAMHACLDRCNSPHVNL